MGKTKKYPNNTPNLNRILKTKKVAKILKISRSFAYLLMQSGQVPTVKIGRVCRVQPQDLADFIDRNK